MTAQTTQASTDSHRLGIYLAHFADHLADHLKDLTHHRVSETESAELKRLLDDAAARIETSHEAIERVLEHLGVAGNAKHMHNHAAHHHHHHASETHSAG